MEKLHFEVQINAPKEKVWDTMLNEATYQEWTAQFDPGSHYKGDWNKGSKILFLAPTHEGAGESGIIGRVTENKKYEFISVEHVGLIQNGIEDTTSELVKRWTPSFENYTFAEKDGGTFLTIDIGIALEHKVIFENMWPKALVALKELVEK